MSYENPSTVTKALGSINFATTTTRVIRLPKGKAGRILDIEVLATVLFTNVTTGAFVQVGDGTVVNKYGSLGSLGALAANASFNTSNQSTNLAGVELPADTNITVTFAAPTGGTPAGTGLVNLAIEVY